MTILSNTQPGVFKKNAIYVRLSADGKTLILEDENGNGGGNVYGAQGRKVTWINDAPFQCKLSFRELFPDDDDEYGGPRWPFSPETDMSPPNCVVLIEGKTSQTPSSWFGHLKRKNKVKYYKYDVDLITPDGVPTPPGIDPIVIIED